MLLPNTEKFGPDFGPISEAEKEQTGSQVETGANKAEQGVPQQSESEALGTPGASTESNRTEISETPAIETTVETAEPPKVTLNEANLETTIANTEVDEADAAELVDEVTALNSMLRKAQGSGPESKME